MRNRFCFYSKKKKVVHIFVAYMIIFLIALILAFTIQGEGLQNLIFYHNANSSKMTIIQNTQLDNSQMSGYSINDEDVFEVKNTDPQLIICIPKQRIVRVKILMGQSVDETLNVQVFYATDQDSGFNEINSEKSFVEKGTDSCEIWINKSDITYLRLDIGNVAGQTFLLDSIVLNENIQLSAWEYIYSNTNWIIVVLWTQVYFICLGFLYLHIIFKVRCLYAFIFHKRWIIAGLILLFFTANKLNGDSLAVYDQIIQPNQGNQLVEPVFGEARYIRSDEFVVDTPSRLASGYGENPYSQYNYIQRGTATLNAVNGIYLGYSTVGKSPFQFVYLFLDRDYAFSFCWYAPIILTFMTAIELCLIISRGKRLLSFTGACLIGLSSFYLWWGFPAFLLGAQGSIVCGYYFINKRKIIQKILFALGLGIAFAFFVLTLYPAWIVAMGYVAIIMVVWILHENWKQVKQFKVLDYILLLGAAVFAGSLIFSYLKVNNEYITAIMNTSYPGQRIENGGFSLPRIFTYYQSYMYGIKDIGNSSEASSFFSFFPIPFIMSVYQWIKTKCKDWFLAGMLGISVVYIIYCTVGIPEAMARVTMLSYCTPTRMIPILGLVEIFLLIRCLSIEGKEQKKYPFWMAILIGGVTTIICSIVSHNSYPGYVTGGWIVISVAIVFIIGVAIQIVRKQKEKRLLEFGLIGISLVTAFTIRPISIGLDAIFSKPVASEIQKICEEENTKWIVRSDDFKVSGFLVACGAPTINSVNTYPNMELWKTLDPDDEYEDIYNRYAHVIVDFVQEKTSFELLYEDSIKINLSYDDLEKTGCSYIFSTEALSENSDKLDFEMIYSEDGSYIYKVVYR